MYVRRYAHWQLSLPTLFQIMKLPAYRLVSLTGSKEVSSVAEQAVQSVYTSSCITPVADVS